MYLMRLVIWDWISSYYLDLRKLFPPFILVLDRWLIRSLFVACPIRRMNVIAVIIRNVLLIFS